MIPDELKDYDQWVLWKYEHRGSKLTKVPYTIYNRRASTTFPPDWNSYTTVSNFLTNSEKGLFSGVGFVFTEDDPFVGIDWDNCLDYNTGVFISKEVEEEIMALNTYAEVSPSGTGIHAICRGKMPAGKCRGNNREMYKSGRFFTVTGQHLYGTPQTVNYVLEADLEVIKKKIDPNYKYKEVDVATISPSLNSVDREDILSVVKLCKDGKNGDIFKTLMLGKYDIYPSQSEADYCLCCIISEFTDNAKIIDTIFRSSKLYRSKWNGYYGTRTIRAAINSRFKDDIKDILFGD